MNSDVIIVGTDTDAGKTTFSVTFLHENADRCAYWKPVETGESDTATVQRCVPHAKVFPPLARFQTPVAPALAAQREGRRMPSVDEVLAAIPASSLPLIIETFGGPLSPFDMSTLQIELIRRLNREVWLVTSAAVGAIGRSLQSLTAMRTHGVEVRRVMLLGEHDDFAHQQLALHWPTVDVVSYRVRPLSEFA